MELLDFHARDKKFELEFISKTRPLTSLDKPRHASMIHELSIHHKKLIQRRFRPSHIGRHFVSRTASQSEIAESSKYLQIAYLVPDEVIKNPNDTNVRSFDAAVVFADISGFTDLSDKYQAVENGASKLSNVLNSYLGTMVQEILSHGGDILKYAGDAFLATFKVTDNSFQNAIHHAIDTSIIIQKYCSNFVTEIGVILNVKIAISCGLVHFSLIGNEKLSHYVVVGEPIWQVKALQEHITGGEILITPKAMFLMKETSYTFEQVRQHRCYKIKGFRDQTNVLRQQCEFLQYRGRSWIQDIRSSKSDSNTNLEISLDSPSEGRNSKTHEERFTVRKTIHEATMNESRKSLRRFIIPPLLNAIDIGDSIDQMTEMRQVVIVFANFVVPEKNPRKICELTNKIFTELNSIVTSFQGTLNKVSLFDKDMMFLSIFGLRGQKLENESEIALRCAYEVQKIFKTWPEISIVSIGVTSGTSYCGIVGHTLRREYSVISVTVNKAARLMMAFPGIISCDEDTLIRSKIDFLRHFKNLPIKHLKGLQGDVRAFEFTDVIDLVEVEVTSNEMEKSTPMVERDEVMEKLRNCVISAIDAFNSNERHAAGTWCFMIRGDGQQGKSRVINELYRECAHQNLKCLRLILNAKHASMPFFTVKYCLSRILEIEKEVNEGIQDAIGNKLSTLMDSDDLSVLNEIFDTNFPSSKEIDDEVLPQIRQIVFRILISNLSRNFWIIFIDDADYIDPESFDLLTSIFDTQAILFIFTIGKHFRKWSLKQKEIYLNEFVTQYRLLPIDKTFHRDIACQSINVSAIPIEFERFLHENSNGNPGWMIMCANALLYAGKLMKKSITVKEAIASGMVLMNDLIAKAENELDIFYDVNSYENDNLNLAHKEEELNEQLITVVELTASLSSKDFVSEYTTRKLMLYDTLSSHDQLVCKCAAILGNEFKRDILIYLIPSSTERIIAQTIVKLFQQFILKCGSAKNSDQPKSKKLSDLTTCGCENLKISEVCRDLPRYGSCANLKFYDEKFRKYIYSTLTEEQRIEYHKRCVSYICNTTRRCKLCKGEKFEEIEELELDGSDGIVAAKKKETNENFFNLINLFKSTRHHHQPIVLNFINHNFHTCTCNNVLYEAFVFILQHCSRVNELKMKTFYSQVTLADICIKRLNIPRALILLDECNTELNDKNNKYDNNTHFIKYIRGRVLMLKGICLVKMMQYDEAIRCYYAASDVYQIKFPTSFNLSARLKLRLIKHAIKTLSKQHHRTAHTRVNSLICDESTFLLQLFYEFYMKAGNFQLAKLAAFWSLKNELKSKRRIENVAKCFSSILHICIILNEFDHEYDEMALSEAMKSTCHDLLDVNGMDEVFKLYVKISEFSFLKHKLTNAINVGEIALKMCYNLPSHENFIEIIPTLALLLLQSERIDAMKKVLSIFYGFMRRHQNRNGLIWYYALAMDLLLDTCHGIITYDECLSFYLELISTTHNLNREAITRFIANLWLWSIRNGMRERCERLMEELRSRFELNAHSSINDIFTGLRVIEALSIHYQRDKNIASKTSLRIMIERYLNILKYSVTTSERCFSERLRLHELHFEMMNKKFSRNYFIARMSKLEAKSLAKKDHFTFNYIRFLKFNLFGVRDGKNHWIEFNLKSPLNPQNIIYFLLPI